MQHNKDNTQHNTKHRQGTEQKGSSSQELKEIQQQRLNETDV